MNNGRLTNFNLVQDTFEHVRKNPDGGHAQAVDSVSIMAYLGLISINYATRVIHALNAMAIRRGYWNSIFGGYKPHDPKV